MKHFTRFYWYPIPIFLISVSRFEEECMRFENSWKIQLGFIFDFIAIRINFILATVVSVSESEDNVTSLALHSTIH